jgi:hypothetical protein
MGERNIPAEKFRSLALLQQTMRDELEAELADLRAKLTKAESALKWSLTTVRGFNEGLAAQTSPSAVLLQLEYHIEAALRTIQGTDEQEL